MTNSNEVTQLFRVIEDALRCLQHGHTAGAEAALRRVVENKQLRKNYEGPRIIYLR